MNHSLQPGSSLSHYRVISPLGAGGMGEVYVAQDTSLERAVALKILPPELMKSEERVRRFIQEAKSASSLSHPHIVTIYEIGKSEVRGSDAGDAMAAPGPGIHFIAMELISGETLKQKIHQEKTDLKALLRYLAQSADGLAKAHAAGIVHRDLKPENIMISRDGYAKVLDFGLAKLTERRETGGDPNNALTATREQTRDGAVMGTVAYMSPEQVQARPVDHRSDIFSFGAILYEAATRSKPFLADSDVEVMHKILRDTPAPIEQKNPEVPSELRRLIRRCMAKSPDQRLQSMKDLAIELSEIADEYDTLSRASATHASGSSVSSPALDAAARKTPTARLALIAALVIGAAGVGFGIYSWMQGRGGVRTASHADTMQMTRLFGSDALRNATISPDGKYVASVHYDQAGFGVWIRQVATGSDVEVVKPLPTPFPGITFSPDGNFIYYVNQETSGPGYSILYQVPALGGMARKLLFDIDSGVSFSPDGRRLAFIRGYPQTRENVLLVANSDGTGERRVASRKSPDGFPTQIAPSWSADGKWIALVDGAVTGGVQQVPVLVNPDTGKTEPLGDRQWGFISALTWVRDGSGVLLSGMENSARGTPQVWFLPYPRGNPRRVTQDLNRYFDVSTTADSRSALTVQRGGQSDIYVAPLDPAAEVKQLTHGAGTEDAIGAVAALGNDRILFTYLKDAAVLLGVLGADSRRTQISPDATVDLFPITSRDGKVIAFQVVPETKPPSVWRMDADGGNRRQVTEGKGERPLAISPDGSWLVYMSSAEKGLFRIPTAGGKPEKIGDEVLAEADISPDGKRVAFAAFLAEDGLLRRKIAVVPAQGGDRLAALPYLEGGQIRFAPGGNAVTINIPRAGVDNIWLKPLDGSPPKQLTRFTDGNIFSYDWTPDGKSLVLSRGKVTSDVILLSDFH
ncbi:MAG TPA: protein kinase [Candidatus Polarisedimenticolia bacterium]|nr:protein kinase [Candidatus Polarisedimenticolia bacterium]